MQIVVLARTIILSPLTSENLIVREEFFGQGNSRPRPPGNPGSYRQTALALLRRGLYTLLRVVRPIASLGLLSLASVCVVLILFSLTFPPGTHFPGTLAAGVAVSCLVAHYTYDALMAWLWPRR